MKDVIKSGLKTPAFFVHHKTYITTQNIDDTSVTLNWKNLEALCKTCHNQEHFKYNQDFNFDENGDLIEINNEYPPY